MRVIAIADLVYLEDGGGLFAGIEAHDVFTFAQVGPQVHELDDGIVGGIVDVHIDAALGTIMPTSISLGGSSGVARLLAVDAIHARMGRDRSELSVVPIFFN